MPETINSPGFDYAFNWLLLNEGTDYVNDPDDGGGPTRYGITQRAWSEFIARQATEQEIADLTEDDARRFYYETYWRPMGLGEYSPNLGLALFDFSVLCGRMGAVRCAQTALRMQQHDGILGPKTKAQLKAIDEPCRLYSTFIPAYARELALRFASIVRAEPQKAKFLRAWLKRTFRLLDLDLLQTVRRHTEEDQNNVF